MRILKLSDMIVANDPCLFDDNGTQMKALTVGQQYQIVRFSDKKVFIKNDLGETHGFDRETLDEFFDVILGRRVQMIDFYGHAGIDRIIVGSGVKEIVEQEINGAYSYLQINDDRTMFRIFNPLLVQYL